MEVERTELVGRLAVLRDELAVSLSGQREAPDPGRVIDIVRQIDTMVCALVGSGLDALR